MKRKIRVLVADDSVLGCRQIASYLDSTDDIEVIAVAVDGHEAIELMAEFRPDVATLDLQMPKLIGLRTLEQVMRLTPTPSVMISGPDAHAAQATLKAIQLGAVDFVLKPVPGKSIDPNEFRLDVISRVRSAARVKVVRAIASCLPEIDVAVTHRRQANRPELETDSTRTSADEARRRSVPPVCDAVIIGASTGGPIAICELLSRLPDDFPVPIVVVQHVPEAFTNVLTTQIKAATPLRTKIAASGESPRPGVVYVASGNQHLVLSPQLKFETNDGTEVCGHRPSIDVTMKSFAQHYPNPVFGVLLTGMGEDGATGLQTVRAHDGKTYAQSPETCVVNGMPQRAIDLGAVDFVGSPQSIAQQIIADVKYLQSKRNPENALIPPCASSIQ